MFIVRTYAIIGFSLKFENAAQLTSAAAFLESFWLSSGKPAFLGKPAVSSLPAFLGQATLQVRCWIPLTRSLRQSGSVVNKPLVRLPVCGNRQLTTRLRAATRPTLRAYASLGLVVFAAGGVINRANAKKGTHITPAVSTATGDESTVAKEV